MQTSAEGLAFLERHEGVVLKAYRDVVGIWTIGAGLTAASGVVKPVAGMTISEAEASRLLGEALRRNYEPAVARTMPGARQHEFDAGVSFHFNTGAIGRASWVRKWIARDWPATRIALLLWNKGGGRVLPGLTRRREEEFALLKDATYGFHRPARVQPPAPTGWAKVVAPVTVVQMPAIRAGLAGLGYPVGDTRDEIAAEAVRAFQRDHGLTADGIIGRATASTLQRVLDARAKAKVPAAIAALGAAEAVPSDGLEALASIPFAGEAAIVLAALRAAWLAFGYRDTLAPALDPHLPRVAALLRSF